MTNEVVVLTEREVFKRFLTSVDTAGGQRAWAAAHGVTPAYVNDMVNRRRKLSARVLAMIGVEVEVITTYREKSTPVPTPAEQMTPGVQFGEGDRDG